MKWLFATLVALNIVVFAGMIGYKVMNKHFPTQAASSTTNNMQAPPQIIINTGESSSSHTVASNEKGTATAPNVTTRTTAVRTISNNTNKATTATQAKSDMSSARAQYRACSARVSMPEDDYHRIKGLLTRFPHAATRQVVENPTDGKEQTASRMNVLFMSLNDQEASTVQGIVGRYGQLNRTACNK